MSINTSENAIYKDREWLKEKADDPSLTTTRIADLADVSDTTIGYWLSKFGLENNRHVNFECDKCGDDVKREWSSYKQRKGPKFCGRECQSKWQSEYRVGPMSPGWKGGKVEVKCVWCGTTKKIEPSNFENYEKHFCSSECKGKWRSENLTGDNGYNWKGGLVNKECHECGKKYQVKISREDEAKYCSKECHWKNMSEKITVECRNCSDEIKIPPSKYKNNNSFSCSWECRWEWRSQNVRGENHWSWKGGYSSYGPNWEEMSEKTRLRDNEKCVNCGIGRKKHQEIYGCDIPVDHINPAKNYLENGVFDYKEANKLENLQTLCSKCHPVIESEK